MDDDVPYAVRGLRANESLSTVASAQKVDTADLLPALNCVRTHARLERPADLRLPKVAHSFILITIDCRVKMDVNCQQDILDSDERVLMELSGIWNDCEWPGEVTKAKRKGGQGRVRGGRSEDGRGEAWVGM